METKQFSTNSNGHCRASKVIPDQKSIQMILEASKKKPQKGNSVIIGRYQWLKRRGLHIPMEMELPNLCLMIKHGSLQRAFYSNVLTHVIKKQNYYIQILN